MPNPTEDSLQTSKESSLSSSASGPLRKPRFSSTRHNSKAKKGPRVLRPLMAFKIQSAPVSLLQRTQSIRHLAIGYKDGILELRMLPRADVLLARFFSHDQDIGRLLHCSFYEDFQRLLTIGADCAVVFYNVWQLKDNIDKYEDQMEGDTTEFSSIQISSSSQEISEDPQFSETLFGKSDNSKRESLSGPKFNQNGGSDPIEEEELSNGNMLPFGNSSEGHMEDMTLENSGETIPINSDRIRVSKLPNLPMVEKLLINLPKTSKPVVEETGIYSLQEEKIQAVEDKHKREEDIQRSRLLAKVTSLRTKFKALQTQNSSLPQIFQVDSHKLTFDREFLQRLEDENCELLLEKGHELEYETHLAEQRVAKLKSYFVGELIGSPFSVSFPLQTHRQIFSFKVKAPTKFMKGLDPTITSVKPSDLLEYFRVVDVDKFRFAAFFKELGGYDRIVFSSLLDVVGVKELQKEFGEGGGRMFGDKEDVRRFLEQVKREVQREVAIEELREMDQKTDQVSKNVPQNGVSKWQDYIRALKARVRLGKSGDYFENIKKKVNSHSF